MNISHLIVGNHVSTPTPAGVLLKGHTGAVTLLQHAGHNILIDTGGRGMFDGIKIKLGEHGLKPADIDMVILTHFHLDHAFNIARFPEANVFGWMHEWREGETLRLPDMEGFSPVDSVTLIKTPGHAEEHLSVVVKDPVLGTVVVAGDAINEEFALSGTVKAFTYDEKLYRESAKRILETADVIIPGHGRMFRP